MLRRCASGHIEATQLSKFAAASRIAAAVIKGWPEAPSSPLQGGAPPMPAAGAAVPVSDFGPEKMLLKKVETELPPCDWACAWPHDSNAAAITLAPMCLRIHDPAGCRSVIYPYRLICPVSGGLVMVANSLTKGQIWTADSLAGTCGIFCGGGL